MNFIKKNNKFKIDYKSLKKNKNYYNYICSCCYEYEDVKTLPIIKDED